MEGEKEPLGPCPFAGGKQVLVESNRDPIEIERSAPHMGFFIADTERRACKESRGFLAHRITTPSDIGASLLDRSRELFRERSSIRIHQNILMGRGNHPDVESP
jgi:hypothetical protein